MSGIGANLAGVQARPVAYALPFPLIPRALTLLRPKPQGSEIDISIRKGKGGAKVPIKLHRGTQAQAGEYRSMRVSCDAWAALAHGTSAAGKQLIGGCRGGWTQVWA